MPSPGGVTLPGFTDMLTRSSFHGGYKMFTCPPAGSGAHCGWGRQQAASGWYSPSAILGSNYREQRRKGGEGPAGDAEGTRDHVRAGSRARGWQTGPATAPRLARHKCVSLRVPGCRGATGTEITPGCHSNIASWDTPCCHPAASEGSPGMGGCSMPQRRMKVPTQPLGSRGAILLPRSSDLCSSTAFTVTFLNPFPREGYAIH